MKINIYIIFIFLIIIKNLAANEIELVSDNVKIFEEGQLFKAYNADTIIKEDEINIKSDEAIYDKRIQELTVIGNVYFYDKKK